LLQSSSSAAKGETLADTVRCLDCYADAIVLRHPTMGSASAAAAASSKPILNAGDGIGEHPTQALLDLFTIQAERGRIDGTHVVLVGDLKHGRTVHSLAKVLSVFSGIRLTCVAPSEYRRSDNSCL
jgi:aspartate carbamoyltransferase catalytic subunit